MNKQSSTTIIVVVFIILFLIPYMAPCLLPFLTSCASSVEESQNNPFDYARITDVEYKAVVVDEPDSEGKIVITERLTFDIHAASKDETFWELWRELPESYVDGVKVDYQVNSVKQIMDDGTEVVWEESDKLYWYDSDYVSSNPDYGPGKWYHSIGPYSEYARRYECLMLYIDNVYRDEMVFEIEYEMHNAALRYNDCSDLYISMYSGSTINHLESYKAEILIPNKDMPAEGNYTVTTYGTDDVSFPVEESATANPGYYTFSIDLDKQDLQFHSYNEFIEFDLVAFGEDKHSFTEYAPSNDYSNWDCLEEIMDAQQDYFDEAATYKTIKLSIFVLSLLATAVLVVCTFCSNALIRKKYFFYKPTTEYDFFRDIPSDLDPNFASALAFVKHKAPKDRDEGVYSAILLSLARKKYIDIKEYSPKDIRIYIKKKPQNLSGELTSPTPEVQSVSTSYEPLTPCEEYYFNLIARHASSDYISMAYLQHRISNDYVNTDTFVKNMERSVVNIGVRDGYFQKAAYQEPKKKMNNISVFLWVIGLISIVFMNVMICNTRLDLAYGSFFIFGIVCIACAIIIRKLGRKNILLTQFGEDEYAKWRGLYNFLNSDTLISERTYVELPIWEKYLVYATAFGLSDKVIEAIKINCPEASSSEMLSNTCYHSKHFYVSSRSIRTATHTGSRIARSGGYGGGGGGSYGGGGFSYGGGGRGGGGGGGGH